MALELKSRSNLKVDPSLVLPLADLKKGFMGVYLKNYVGPATIPFTLLWATQLFPELVANPEFDISVRNANKLNKVITTSTNVSSGYTKVRKEQDHMIVEVPVFNFAPHPDGSSFIEYFEQFFASTPKVDTASIGQGIKRVNEVALLRDEEGSAPTLKRQRLDVRKAIGDAVHKMGGNAALRANLDTCLTQLEVRTIGGSGIVFATFKVTRAEAQHLTSTPWTELRTQDLYPLMQTWVMGYFGTLDNPPRSSFNIRKIARTLPTDVHKMTIKVNQNMLTCDSKGRPLYIPAVVDNTLRYEELFGAAGYQPDDSFALLDQKEVGLNIFEGKSSPSKLPANIPVLVDWVNNKFSYTNTNGMLNVQNLSGCRLATPVHVDTWLGQPADRKLLDALVHMGEAVGVTTAEFEVQRADIEGIVDSSGQALTPDAVDAIMNRAGRFTLADLYVKQMEGIHFRVTGEETITWGDLAHNSEYTYLRPVGRYVKKILNAALVNMDNLYHKYSVSYTTHRLPYAILIAIYAPQASVVKAKAMAITAPAMAQGVDPNYKNPALPLLNPKIGRLPHQARIANELRDSPDFALLRVAAGGGKTIMIVTDILAEIKANRNAPYLVMCPAHLVAQYCKEIVFFTKGQLNVIPVNSYTLKRNGFDRLTRMIQTAPRNTVVIVDYDAVKLRGQQVCYGTTAINVFPVAELLKQFSFGICYLDESHYLKNESSARTRAVLNVITDIPKKRLASGTMAHDSPSDLAMQVAMLDPTLFGTKDEFNDTYGEEVRGGRVVIWKPGAQRAILQRLKTRVVDCVAMRKEWAALLPPIKERMIPVVLTERQSAVYNAILQETVELIKQDKALSTKLEEQANAENPEGAIDEDEGDDLAAMLKPYLARLEQFITAPARDPVGNLELQGEDRISPKVLRIIEIIREHLDANMKGKILVFTNYTASAEEIYDLLPKDLKAKAILYVAEQKIEAGAQFETDDGKQIMIGVENSMNTGLNLQQVSRLIRTETVWNPGTLEQGNARINRPEMKKEDTRDTIFFDWILAEKTIDITKVSRLTAKIVAIGKFENAGNPDYEAIEDVPVIKMSLDNILAHNSWSEDMLAYAQAYSQYRTTVRDEYAEYKAEFIAKWGDDFIKPIGVSEVPGDAKLMARTPYVPGLEVYAQNELGLLRLDDYLRNDFADDLSSETESDNEDVAEIGTKEYRDQINTVLKGQRIHTEFGDGVIKRLAPGPRVVAVELDDGTEIGVKFSAAFLITRPETSMKDIRNAMAKEAGELPLDTPVDVPPRILKQIRVTKKELNRRKKEEEQKKAEEVVESLAVELQFTVTNGFLGITMFTDGEDSPSTRALQALGFNTVPEFYYAKMRNHLQLYNQIVLWNENGLVPDQSVVNTMGENGTIVQLHNLLKTKKLSNRVATYKFANKNQLRNFYRMEVIPTKDPKTIKPYPIIEDGEAYLALPIRGQVGTRAAIKLRAPGVRWLKSEPQLAWYGMTPQALATKLKKIVGAGIQISNLAELKSDWKNIKRVQVRENVFQGDV